MTTGEPLSNFLHQAVLASETRHINVCEVNGRKFILTVTLEEETGGSAGGAEDIAVSTRYIYNAIYLVVCIKGGSCDQNSSTVMSICKYHYE